MNLRAPIELLSVFKVTTRERWDLGTPLAMLALSGISLSFIYSAQFSTAQSDWVKQLVFMVIGAGVYVAVSLIDYRFWISVIHWFYIACIILLLVVLVPGIGQEV